MEERASTTKQQASKQERFSEHPPLYIPMHLRAGSEEKGHPARPSNPRVLPWWGKIFFFLVIAGISGTMLAGLGGLAIFARYAKGIPAMTSLKEYEPPLPSMMFSADGDAIAEYAAQRRILVPYEKLPKKLLQAFVAAEDDRFFLHSGVDPVGILRAVVKNLKAGKLRAGGSTLTQQVAKSFLFDRLVVWMRQGLCRSDQQCGWRERCQARPGEAYGRCIPRSFQACGKQVTVIHQGKPTQVYRGYSTICDPHEVCQSQCKDEEANRAGLCPQWTCTPTQNKPTCSSDGSCGFGERCLEGECKPDFATQVSAMLDKLIQAGAEIDHVKGPQEVLQTLTGSFRRTPHAFVIISTQKAGQIEPRTLETLSGVHSIYRFAEKSLRRKIREAILATRLERQFRKEDILWLYLNQVYLGHQSYGVQAAAQNYFGKDVWDLTAAESATIAGLPQSPSKYDPYRFPDKARVRMRYVLGRMREMNFLSEAEYQEAMKEDVKTQPLSDVFRKKVPYFADEVRKQILKKYGKEKLMEGGLRVYTTVDTEKQMLGRVALRQGLEKLDQRQGYRGPLGSIAKQHWSVALEAAAKAYGPEAPKIGQTYGALVTKVDNVRQVAEIKVGKHEGILPLAGMRWARKPNPNRSPGSSQVSSVSPTLKAGYWILAERISPEKLKTGNRGIDRRIPEEGLLFRLRQHPKVEGAVLSIEAESGYVESLVGGYSFDRSEFNRAMYACRQPGSSFKPVVYAAGMELGETRKEAGRELNEPITPGTILLDSPLVHDSGADNEAARYKPSNYSGRYEGEVTVRHALIKSMNIPSIRLLLKLGLDRALEMSKKMGIQTALRKELGLALGQSCVRPWELSVAYATMARGGLRPHPTLIRVVTDRRDEILEDHRFYDDPAMSPESRFNRLEASLFRHEERVLSKETAYLITHLMRQVVLQGTGFKVKNLKKPAAGKTGTTNDAFDVWFMGMTPLHVTAVWLGFDKNETPLGSWESGGDTAVPVWLKYMIPATKGLDWPEWEAPEQISWARIDLKTGKLANVDTPNAARIPFLKGTEPRQVVERQGKLRLDDVGRDY